MQNILYIPCPLCVHNSSSANSELWTHGEKCGGTLYVDEYAYVHCKKCGKKAHISKMRVSCNCGRHRYQTASRNDIAAAASFAKIGVTSNSIKWLRDFVSHL